MPTHTEDTKEMTAETRHMLIVSVRNWDDGTISFLDFEKNVEELLTTYASRVREERDREIVAYCDEQIAHEIGLGGKNSNKQVIETYEYVKEFIKL